MRITTGWKVALVLGGGLLAGSAVAQTIDLDQTTSRPDDYPGVVPGRGNPPPHARRAERQPRAVVTWPGFEIRESGTRIFVQSTRNIAWDRRNEDRRIVITLRNARIHLTNNLNPLVTRHFSQTPVDSAKLTRRGSDVNLVIELKSSSDAAVRFERVDDGYHYLYVDFPSGTYLTPESNLPVAGEPGVIESRNVGGGVETRRGRGGGGDAAPAPAPAPAPAQ